MIRSGTFASDLAIKGQLFSGQPFCTIQGFSQYKTRVDQLPLTERKKLENAAEFVAKSYYDPALTGGFVIAIGIRGHADQDFPKTGQARLDSERKMSEDRAKDVAAALVKAIKARALT